jgi:hypothetical protein
MTSHYGFLCPFCRADTAASPASLFMVSTPSAPLGLKRGNPQPIDDPNIANADGGDGSNIGAYEADPNMRINAFEKTGGDIWLSFNSMLGRTYRVESTDELPPTWSVLTNNVIGTGGRFQAIDGGAASLPKRFYRTVQLP